MLKQILNPDYYHGKNKKKSYFEGWYFKIVDKDQRNVFAFIPGIIKSSKGKGHSFIQVLDGKGRKSHYLKNSMMHFNAKNNQLYIEVDKNTFSLSEMRLNYYSEDFQMIGTLKFIDLIKWPDSIINPGSMGFYNYLLFMECYSQVCCLDGRIIGKLLINNEEIDFTGGDVYIEKNWGKSFPQAYIWIQSNSFKGKNVALTCSIGKIPFKIFRFTGFLAAIKIDDDIYKFTTMNRSRINIELKGKDVKIICTRKDIRLTIETNTFEDEFLNIKGPIIGKMDIIVKESLVSQIKVELYDLKRDAIIYEGNGFASGIELMGNLKQLIRNK